MKFDLAVLALMAAFGLWGAVSGARRQLLGLAALSLAFLAAVPLGEPYAVELVKRYSLRSYLGPVVATLAAFVCAYVSLQVVLGLWLLVKGDREGAYGARERLAGLSLGAVQGFLLAFIALSSVTPAEYELTLLGRSIHSSPEGSLAVQLARENNAFAFAAPLTNASLATDVHQARPAGPPGAAHSTPRMGANLGGLSFDLDGDKGSGGGATAPSTIPMQRARSVQGVMDRAVPNLERHLATH